MVIFTFSYPSSHASGIIFIDHERDFFDLIRTKKKMMVELEYFNHGDEAFTFDLPGLQMEKLGLPSND